MARKSKDQSFSETKVKVKDKIKEPSMYKVVMLNDDFTPMDFVIDVVCKVFRKDVCEATDIMLSIHKTGVGICGVYTYEVAETKVIEVVNIAKNKGHPLQCQIEKA